VVTVLTDILFNSGSAKILPEGKEVLDSISKVLKNVPPENHIVIEGHTDNEPIKYSGWKSNWDLSTARALSVVHYLIYECGFDAERFSIQGYGEFRPVGDNSTESSRRQNRRVEIVIQPKVTKVRPSSTPDNINLKTPSQASKEPPSP
jgi:chemotaxis protein MotB